jgi:HlyD family secretion protein
MSKPLFMALMLAGCDAGATQSGGYAGTIEVTELELAAAVPGRLTEVRFEEGDAVAAGDLAFSLDATNLKVQHDLAAAAAKVAAASVGAARSQVRTADAQVAFLSREVDRLQKMEAAGVGSPQQRSTLEGQLSVARAQAARAADLLAVARTGGL